MPLVTLDRVVSGRAVLADEEGNEWEIPAAALPAGCAEGAVVEIKLRLRKGATKDLEREIAQLQNKLNKLKKVN